MSRDSRLTRWLGVTMCAAAFCAGEASAVPVLQLYIEGASYDSGTQSWYVAGGDFRLWAIANLGGPGGTGGTTIGNVRLSAVYDDPGTPVTITVTPTKIGGTGTYNGFTDAAQSAAPTFIRIVTDGSTPRIGGDSFLPGHGEYGAGKTWYEFALGDFNAADSQLGDFVGTFPIPGTGTTAQINAYDVHVEGADAHFDLYGTITNARGKTSYVFAPFSHDATDGSRSVPVPATLVLLGIGGAALASIRFGREPKRRQR